MAWIHLAAGPFPCAGSPVRSSKLGTCVSSSIVGVHWLCKYLITLLETIPMISPRCLSERLLCVWITSPDLLLSWLWLHLPGWLEHHPPTLCQLWSVYLAHACCRWTVEVSETPHIQSESIRARCWWWWIHSSWPTSTSRCSKMKL